MMTIWIRKGPGRYEATVRGQLQVIKKACGEWCRHVVDTPGRSPRCMGFFPTLTAAKKGDRP